MTPECKALWILITALAAGCATHDRGGHLYSYPDADGRIVVLERPAESPQPQSRDVLTDLGTEHTALPAAAEPRPKTDSRLYRQVPNDLADDEAADISLDIDDATLERLQANERDRFITYYDVEGRLVREPVDLVAAREYRASHKEYEDIAPGVTQTDDFLQAGYIQTVTPVTLECCQNAFDEAVLLGKGEELVFSFQQKSGPEVLTPQGPRRAVFVKLAPELATVEVQSFKLREGYLHPFVLLLDAQAMPAELINNVFTRRYKETWARYGHLEGTISVDKRLLFMVFYIPYEDTQGARAAGILPEPGTLPAVTGQLVLKGR